MPIELLEDYLIDVNGSLEMLNYGGIEHFYPASDNVLGRVILHNYYI
jgi:hypothetical protein